MATLRLRAEKHRRSQGPRRLGKDASHDHETTAQPQALQWDKQPGRRWIASNLISFLAFVAFSATYFALRTSGVFDFVEYRWYAAAFLLCEAAGAVSVMLYGLSTVLSTTAKRHSTQETDSSAARYDVQVLVPCYTEALDIVAETVWAAHCAVVPPGCKKTVWLLDDGKDSHKEAWVQGLSTPSIKYLTGRRRPPGERNGKAGNLNSALQALYPGPPGDIALDRIVAVFDCDQICNPQFFMRTLPLLSGNVALVLTPQVFGNVDAATDIFNHSNRHFWEMLIPGLMAWGMAVCTGSNLLLRAQALMEVGGFPGQTVTEDFALGMELNKRKWKARYLPEYLAVGEAPEEGAIFRQRSRWCKGHLQAFLSADCPLAQPRLPLILKLLYAGGTWSYACAAVTTPFFAVVPIVAILTGVFPLSFNPALAAAFLPYFISMQAVLYHTFSPSLLQALWFANVSTHILWWTYLKAIYNTMLGALGLKKKGSFKTTIKTGILAASTPHPAPGTPRNERSPIFVAPDGAGKAAKGVTVHASISFSQPSLLKTISEVDQEGGLQRQGTDAGQLLRQPSSARSFSSCEFNRLLGPAQSFSMPELTRHLSVGIRPAWDLELEPQPSAASQVQVFAQMVVRGFSTGPFRDVWAPMLVLAVSLLAAFVGLVRIFTSPARSMALGVSVAWALYSCIGPYLLFHYTWIGRGRSLRWACAVAAAACILVTAGATATIWLLAPPVYNYGEVLSHSYRFYEAHQSGVLPPGHRVPWRGDSALQDHAPSGGSLVGGWFDAGDHLKTSFSIAIAATFLAWGILEFPNGHAKTANLERARANVRWAADYLMACHTGPNEFVGQVGNMETDHAFWGRPEDLDAAGVPRPAYVINITHSGSDMAASAAAALAAVSMVFRASDAAYAGAALEHARGLFAFADAHRGPFGTSVPDMGAVYPSEAFLDDLAWAAGWLYRATRENAYLRDAHNLLAASRAEEPERWTYFVANWANLVWPAQLLLARVSGSPSAAAGTAEFLDRWRLGRTVTYTPRGLAFSDEWGTLRNTANTAMLALIYAKHVGPAAGAAYACWAQSQIRYMLGDAGRSFVVGYGRSPPERAHHRGASCPPRPAPCNFTALHSPLPNPHTLLGALVGGPNLDDSFLDDRAQYAKSEVGIEYNAGFTAALAGLVEQAIPWQRCLQANGALYLR